MFRSLFSAIASLLLLVAFSVADDVRAQAPPGATQIQHVIFILKENHTLDNYFGVFPASMELAPALLTRARRSR